MVRVAINGLGRIGRCIIRAAIELNKSDIHIVAANGTVKPEDYVSLLKYDSVHGIYQGDITCEKDFIYIGKHKIQILSEPNPELIPWDRLNVDIILECTGKFTNKNDALKHIKAGAKKVIVSAPCKDADATIVYGVNNHVLNKNCDVISIGSCTTNALAPIVKILNENVGIECGYMTTIHSYTNDQNLLDNRHKDPRRARACALSMIPTSTGAAKAIGIVLPELDGKLAGSAIRVPTPNVSLVDLTFNAIRKTTKLEINQFIIDAANKEFKNIVGVTETTMVSIDFNHNPNSSIFDPYETQVVLDKMVRVVSWYDNEWAFAARMLDVAKLFKSLF
jgi:glyceraldehyde 3-phosphate dehydrogenase